LNMSNDYKIKTIMNAKGCSFLAVFKTCIKNISPRRVAALGYVLGTLVWLADMRHQRIVKRNLRFAYPEWSDNYIGKVSRHVFENAAKTFLEICQITCFSKEDILKRVRIRGEENLRRAVENPKGAIMISAHLGNWEMAHLAISCYASVSMLLVARRIRPEMLNQGLARVRRRFGNTVVDKSRALPKMARRLNGGKVLGLLIDQKPKHSRGVDVTFFGKPTTITPAPALLARRYGSPILPAFCIRETDGRLTLIVEPAIQPVKTNDPGADLKANMQAMSLSIERAIRAYPDQWFWFHKRWKHHFPHLYKEDLDRLRRRRAKKRKA